MSYLCCPAPIESCCTASGNAASSALRFSLRLNSNALQTYGGSTSLPFTQNALCNGNTYGTCCSFKKRKIAISRSVDRPSSILPRLRKLTGHDFTATMSLSIVVHFQTIPKLP